jgi:hypothetical protein
MPDKCYDPVSKICGVNSGEIQQITKRLENSAIWPAIVDGDKAPLSAILDVDLTSKLIDPKYLEFLDQLELKDWHRPDIPNSKLRAVKLLELIREQNAKDRQEAMKHREYVPELHVEYKINKDGDLASATVKRVTPELLPSVTLYDNRDLLAVGEDAMRSYLQWTPIIDGPMNWIVRCVFKP